MPGHEIAVVLAAAASDDVQAIYRHIADNGSVAAADGVYARI